MPGPDLSYALGLTPVEAVRYFRSKGIAVTENWHDLWQEAQARAFTVTGITTSGVRSMRRSKKARPSNGS